MVLDWARYIRQHRVKLSWSARSLALLLITLGQGQNITMTVTGMADLIGMRRDTVGKALTELADHGLLVEKGQGANNNKYYRLTMPTRVDPVEDQPVGPVEDQRWSHRGPAVGPVEDHNIKNSDEETTRTTSSSAGEDEAVVPSSSKAEPGCARAKVTAPPGRTSWADKQAAREATRAKVGSPAKGDYPIDPEDVKLLDKAINESLVSLGFSLPAPFSCARLRRVDRLRFPGMVVMLYDEDEFTADELIVGLVLEGDHNPRKITDGARWLCHVLRDVSEADLRKWIARGREHFEAQEREAKEVAERREREAAEAAAKAEADARAKEAAINAEAELLAALKAEAHGLVDEYVAAKVHFKHRGTEDWIRSSAIRDIDRLPGSHNTQTHLSLMNRLIDNYHRDLANAARRAS
jgi:hypothetical protein